MDAGWTDNNPTKVLKPPRVQSGPKMPFTEDELAAIYEACDALVPRGTLPSEASFSSASREHSSGRPAPVLLAALIAGSERFDRHANKSAYRAETKFH